jgi:glutamate-1-semialdehyde 2,1-aminomutase
MLFSGLAAAARKAAIDVTVNRVGSMGSLFFSSEPVRDFSTAKQGNFHLFPAYYKSMRDRGIYLAPSPFEASFLSAAHTEEVVQKTIACAEGAFGVL